jgi:lipid-binding SYLF domain-containing protein
MIKQRISALMLVIAVVGASSDGWADGYDDARSVFQGAGASSRFFENSYGYALFPTIGKGGFGIGAAHGKGRVFVGGAQVGNTSMTQVTIGFQLGGQAYSMIIFFEDQRAFDDFSSGNFEFSAQATAVAITAGASASTSTGGGSTAGASGGQNNAKTAGSSFSKGMAAFTIAKGGFMYEASLGGQKFNYKPVTGSTE